MKEANLNLYNKYRPKSFKEVIGQSLTKELLLQSLEQKKSLQTFIFYGPNGTGKTSLARIFAKACNCENFESKLDACNECSSCELIENNRTTDIYEVDAASHSGVENMRELIQNSHYVPLNLKKKIYIIDEAHSLSPSAWNSLLKTIEEPHSENIIFLFLTTNIYKIPNTILSRCQKHNFSRLRDEDLKELINKVITEEDKEIEESAIDSLVSLSQGSARECLSLLDQIFLSSSKRITFEDTERTFCLSNKKDLLKLIEILKNSDLNKGIEFINNLLSIDRNLLNYFSQLLSIFIELYAYEKTNNPSLLKDLSSEEANRFINKNLDFLKYGDILERAINRYEYAQNKTHWAHMTLFYLLEVSPAPIPKRSEMPKEKIIEEEFSESKIEVKTTEPEEKEQEKKEEEIIEEIEAPPEEPTKDFDYQINLKLEKPQEKITKFSKDLENKILYGLSGTYIDEEKTKENYEIYKSLLNSNRVSPKLLGILKKAKPIQKKIITTNKTVILRFKNELDVLEFNEITKDDEINQELEDLFMAKYEWIGLSTEQIKYYSGIRKQDGFKEISPEIFDDKNNKEKEFLELLGILEET